MTLSTEPKCVPEVKRGFRWPGISYEKNEALLITAPSLHGQSIYLAIHIHRGRSHIGWGRQFLPGDQPWWAHYIWWGGNA